ACVRRSRSRSATSPRRRHCWPPWNSGRAKTPTAAASTPNDVGAAMAASPSGWRGDPEKARRHGGSYRSAGDVALQVVQLELLVLDHRLDQVADRDHADHRLAIEHRQVADAPVGD